MDRNARQNDFVTFMTSTRLGIPIGVARFFLTHEALSVIAQTHMHSYSARVHTSTHPDIAWPFMAHEEKFHTQFVRPIEPSKYGRYRKVYSLIKKSKR